MFNVQNIRIYSKHLIRRQRRLASKPLSDGPIRSTGRIVGTTSYMATCSPCSHKGMQRRRDKSRLQGAHMTSDIEQLDLEKYNFFPLTGFFFTCWLAARMQRWEGFCEDHRKIVRFFFLQTSALAHTHWPCDGGVYFFEFISRAAWAAALLGWQK